MRTAGWLTMALICAALMQSIAQDTDPVSRTIFKLSPQHFIQNSLKAGVERFNPTHSRSFVIFLTGMMNNNDRSYYAEGYNALAGEFQLRKYISPLKTRTSKNNRVFHQGVFGAVYAQGGYYTGDFKGESGNYDRQTGAYTPVYFNYSEDIVNGGFGFTIGYQKTLWQVVFLEAFVGGGIQFSDRNFKGLIGEADQYYSDGILDPYYRGVLPKIGLNIGLGL